MTTRRLAMAVTALILCAASVVGACGNGSTPGQSAEATSSSGRNSTTSSVQATTNAAATASTAAPSAPPASAPAPSAGCLSDVDATALLQSEGKPDDYRAMTASNIDCRDDWAMGEINDDKDDSPGTILFRRNADEWRFLYAAWSVRAVCDVAFQEAAPEWIRESLVCWSKPDYVSEGGTGEPRWAFRSPSRNITCNLDESFATCSVGNASWDLPEPPDECLDGDGNLTSDWGSHVQFMDDQPAALICRGDAPTEGPVLPYGHSVEIGPVSCRSEQDGVTCTNSETRHGFKVNRASYDVF